MGGPTHDPRLTYWAQQQYQNQTHNSEGTAGSTETYQQEVTLAEHFEHSAEPIPEPGTQNPSPPPLTPSEALRLKHQHLHSISVLATQFGAKIVDVSDNSIIVEMSGKTNRVEAFLGLLKPFGIIESARTGMSFFFSLLFFFTCESWEMTHGIFVIGPQVRWLCHAHRLVHRLLRRLSVREPLLTRACSHLAKNNYLACYCIPNE